MNFLLDLAEPLKGFTYHEAVCGLDPMICRAIFYSFSEHIIMLWMILEQKKEHVQLLLMLLLDLAASCVIVSAGIQVGQHYH